MEITAKLKSLDDLDPKPQGGQWYTVMPHDKSVTRVVVLIDDVCPNIAIDWFGRTGIARFFEPVLVTKEEAKIHLKQEIENMKNALENDITDDRERSAAENVIRLNQKFYQKYFLP
ncbi:MAG: hypothetical protein WCO58_03030 [bacterium]